LFTCCEYCKKYFTSENYHSLLCHVRAAHYEHYEEWKQKNPGNNIKLNKNKKERIIESGFPDHTKQIENKLKPFRYYCAICK